MPQRPIGPVTAKVTRPPTTRVLLDPIKLGPISEGGYKISYSVPGKAVLTGFQVLLAIGNDENTLDITGRSRTDAIGPDNLPDLLDLFDEVGQWGADVLCKVILKSDNAVIGSSNEVPLSCPVTPFDGAPTLDTIACAEPALTYPGNGEGRTWKLIGERRYFSHRGKFETDMARRGFDCTTFPMALFECYPNMAGKYGTALAEALGTVKCGMEQKKESEIKAFFAGKGKNGLYFMWSAGHVVLVQRGTVHEFTYGGYKRTAASGWTGYRRAPQGLWWVRQLLRSC